MAKNKPTVFDDLAAGARRMDYVPRTREAQSYYRRKARSLRTLTPRRMIRNADTGNVVTRIPKTTSIIGHMVMFQYDPKTKDTLPYYDIHPLVFIVKPLPDGFLGLNFHYLPYRWRAILLNRLTEIATNDKFDETTRILMTYKILARSARFKAFQPCLKRYLTSQVQSKFLWIPSQDWEIAIFLPVQKFMGASNEKVWKDSRRSFI